MCIARIGAAGLTAADFNALDRMNAFMEPMGGFTNWMIVDRAVGFDGLVLETILYVNGAQVRRDTVQKIERTDIPAGTFDLPAGFAFRPSGPRPRP